MQVESLHILSKNEKQSTQLGPGKTKQTKKKIGASKPRLIINRTMPKYLSTAAAVDLPFCRVLCYRFVFLLSAGELLRSIKGTVRTFRQ